MLHWPERTLQKERPFGNATLRRVTERTQGVRSAEWIKFLTFQDD